MKKIYLLICLMIMIKTIQAQNYSLLNSVMCWAEVNASKPSLTLKWQKDTTASKYDIHRKAVTAKAWPAKALASLTGDALSFEDTTVVVGQAYEYRIKRTAGAVIANTYLYGGVNVNQIDIKKSILLLVDERIKTGIQTEINQLKSDLANETWNVIELGIPASKTALQVKDTIRQVYNKFPNLGSIFIIGHVAVPYSGNTNWDGHPDHQGAWVCDNYYADIDGLWTDEFVSNNSASRPENQNEIGDEKWDNDVIPSDVEFEVGRVDFFNMPGLVKSETQLLKNYLDKDHLFRIGKIRPSRRAIVQDNFNFQGEFFGSSGYKNFTTFFGPDSVKTDIFRDRLLEKSYLCAYGAGGGWYQGAGGISTTPQMATDSLRTVFTFLFGSYFGDWDVQDNFLRSSLASGTVLTCAWAGRPGWQIHHMAMGESIGFSTKATVNNGQYTGSPYGNKGAHVSLLGDPSLSLLPVLPPSGLTAVESGNKINLMWTASSEATEGYVIFRKKTSDLSFVKIADKIKALTYSDNCLDANVEYEYLVCAVKLETDASGTFYNRSPGIRASITPKNSSRTKADISLIQDYEFLTAVVKSSNSTSNIILINGQTYKNDSLYTQLACNPSNYNIQLISQGTCNADTITKTIKIVCSVPNVTKYSFTPEIKCFGDLADVHLDSILGASPFTYQWSNGATTNPVKNVKGKISVIVTSSKNTKDTLSINLPEFTQIIITNIQVKNVNPGFNKGKVTGVISQGGVPPYTSKVLNVSNPDSLDAGTYTLEVTDANGCKSTKTFEIKMNTAVNNIEEKQAILFPNPTQDELFIRSENKIDGIIIYNLDGKKILINTIQPLSNEIYKLNTSSLTNGIYFIELKFNNRSVRMSFVKE